MLCWVVSQLGRTPPPDSCCLFETAGISIWFTRFKKFDDFYLGEVAAPFISNDVGLVIELPPLFMPGL